MFIHKYEFDLKKRANQEQEEIAKLLADKIVNAKDLSEFKNLLKNGIKKGVIEYKMIDHGSLGFTDIIKAISKIEKDIPYRKEKIFILLTGKDDKEEQIWNEKNKIKSLKTYYPLKDVLNKDEWNNLVKTMIKRGIHIYRNKKNRQGHDNNHLSYWARGFNSIQEMISCSSEKEIKKYAEEHSNCCGFYKGEYTIMRRCDKGMGLTKKRKEKYATEVEKNSPNIIRGRSRDRYRSKNIIRGRSRSRYRSKNIIRGRSRGRYRRGHF